MTRRSLGLVLASLVGLAGSSSGGWAAEVKLDRYRTGMMDARVRAVPATIQQGVFADPEHYIEPLVKSLTQGVDDPFLKVKILHDWIADNIAYDVGSFFSGDQTDSSWSATLRRRQAVCYGYAAVMLRLCQAAGIPCATILGYGRGYRYGIGRAETPADVNHAWNAVALAGRWYLVDVTWDAGHVDDQRAFRKAYHTAYLFAEPHDFLYTHLPKEPGWQLIRPPLSTEQFLNLPYLTGQFFEHGLRLVTALSRVTRVGPSVQFTLAAPADVVVMARLKTTEGVEEARRTLVARETGTCRVLVAFPQAGRWSVHLFAKQRGNPGMYQQVATLEFESTDGTAYTFPMTYAAYDALDACLYSPLFVPLAGDRPTEFRLRASGAEEVQLAIGDRPWERLTPEAKEAGLFRLTATVPRGLPAKLVTRDPSTGAYTTLVDFGMAR